MYLMTIWPLANVDLILVIQENDDCDDDDDDSGDDVGDDDDDDGGGDDLIDVIKENLLLVRHLVRGFETRRQLGGCSLRYLSKKTIIIMTIFIIMIVMSLMSINQVNHDAHDNFHLPQCLDTVWVLPDNTRFTAVAQGGGRSRTW